MPVSVIIKTLNEAKRIGPALESVLAALEPIGGEIIVADSGSSDDTVKIALSYGVIVAQIQPPATASCGIGPQLGFQYSVHDFVCLMDGDMLLDPGFLPAALAYLEANPEAGGVTGHVKEMNVVNLEFARRVRRVTPENRTGTIDRMNGGGLYRRAAVLDAGYFSDRNLHGYEEFDLGVRMRSRGWSLHRMDLPFVAHFGHSINAYALLVGRWRSKYLHGVGELLRAAWRQPYLPRLVKELPELRLWAAVYLWWAAMIALPFVTPTIWLGLLIDIAICVAVVGAMSLKQRSLTLGVYAVVAWLFHAAALPVGFLRRRRPPEAWIESQVLGRGS